MLHCKLTTKNGFIFSLFIIASLHHCRKNTHILRLRVIESIFFTKFGNTLCSSRHNACSCKFGTIAFSENIECTTDGKHTNSHAVANAT